MFQGSFRQKIPLQTGLVGFIYNYVEKYFIFWESLYKSPSDDTQNIYKKRLACGGFRLGNYCTVKNKN